MNLRIHIVVYPAFPIDGISDWFNGLMKNFDAQITPTGDRIKTRLSESKEYFEQQREKWDGIEKDLFTELESVTRQLDQWEDFYEGMQRSQLSLRKEKQLLDEKEIELSSRSCQLDEEQLELESRRRHIERKLEQQRSELDNGAVNEELEKQIRFLQDELESVQARSEENTNDRESIDRRIQEAESDREKMEANFHATRQALLAAREAGKELQEKLSETEHQLESRTLQLKETQSILEVTEDRMRKTQAAYEEKSNELILAQTESGTATVSEEDHLALRQERDDLSKQVQQLTEQLQASGKSADESRQTQELKSKMQMAMDSLEAMRARNSDLEAQLEQRGDDGHENSASSKLLDEIVTSLPPLDQLTLDKAIRVTESIVAQRDLKIAELEKALQEALENAARSGDENAPTTSAEVQAEIEKLRSLEAELQQKMKKAEIEISLKRAETARAAAELEERIRDFEQGQDGGRSLRGQLGLS